MIDEEKSPLQTTANGAAYRPVRVFYTKGGRAKYISHLDVTRCMQRAVKRAGLSLWYTEGFNPHIYLTFALPLPLGYESGCESMDIRLMAPTSEQPFEAVAAALNNALPPDIRVTAIRPPQRKPEEIAAARYRVELLFPEESGAGEEAAFHELLESGPIEVEKHSKKGNKIVDIRPDVTLLAAHTEGDSLLLSLQMTAGQARNINPTLLTDEFLRRRGAPDTPVRVTREALLCGDETEFR